MTYAAAFGLLLCAWVLSIVIVAFAIVRFLRNGWWLRRDEFLNRMSRGSLEPYFLRFGDARARNWARARARRGGQRPARTATREEIRLFRAMYDRLVGWRKYVGPALVLGAMALVSTGFVAWAALHLSNDAGRLYALKREALAAMLAHLERAPATLKDFPGDALHRLQADDPYLHLLTDAVAAVSGAYLWVTASLIQECRARTLVYSDLLFAALRLLTAAPVGLSVAATVAALAPATAPFVAFAVGAFPFSQLTRIVQRLALVQLNAGEKTNALGDEQLVAMMEVTTQVADVLMAEGIACPQQLAEKDPVALALRTGLSFDYVVWLSAQAMVWTYLGPTTIRLGPLGLADARAIRRLMRDTVAVNVVLGLVATEVQVPLAVLRFDFERIAGDDYTGFLASISV